MLMVACYGSAPVFPMNEQSNIIVAMIVISVLLGFVLVMATPMLWNIFSSLLFSTYKIVKNTGGELNQNRNEVTRMSHALTIIDSINKTKTRLCVLINGLDVNDQSQLVHLVRAVHDVYSVHPIITIICIDYHLVVSALQNSTYRY